MVGPAYDFLMNPLGAVRTTFQKTIASGLDPASFDGKDWGAVDLFRHFLVDQGGLSQVPILTPATVGWAQPNTLVRFRGMIQDMLGNEFYVGAYKDGSVWRTNKFTDISHCPMSSSADTRIWERRLLYCVPVPGLNAWTEVSSEAFKNKLMDWANQHREKRRRVDHESSDCEEMPAFDVEVHGSQNTKKVRAEEPSSCASQSWGPVLEAPGSGISLVPDLDGNFPPCLVKMYDCPESDLKLNDVFEFVGVLSCDPELQVDNEDHDSSKEFYEDPMPHLPASKVPYLHCIIHRKLTAKDFLQNSPIIEVHARVDTVAVGKLSLNLTCFSKEIVSVFGNQLTTSIKNLLPFSCCIPLTVDYLNTASLAPRKDYDNNRLVTGVLQLAEGSHVIFDETKLEAGTLNSVGVDNARLLKIFVELQQVEYDFKYYKMEMAADVQLLVLSEGKSNILPADVIVPFRPSAVNHSEATVAEAVEAWRLYLATVRLLPHCIESEMQKVVENDLVAARREDRSLNPQDFSRWLTMGRLMSLSFGETSLSLEHWQMIKELERLRKERLE